MTVELDQVVKNLKNKSLTVELEDDNGTIGVYIQADGDSGAGYQVTSVQDIGEFLTHYLMNYFTD